MASQDAMTKLDPSRELCGYDGKHEHRAAHELSAFCPLERRENIEHVSKKSDNAENKGNI